jgi:hypothetical protein
MEGAWENGTEVTHMTSVAINDQRPKRALSDAQLAELASPATLVGAMRRARQEGRFVTCSNRIAGPVAVIHYGIFMYASGTVNPQAFNWRAHVPRLSFVTRTTSIGMISGTSCLSCTLSMMRWTDI